MAKILSVKEKKLQKLLIPLNIFVCILSIVAIISLYFAPVIKVDVGKILRQEETISLIEQSIDEAVGGAVGGGESTVDFVPVVASVVKEVVTKANGSVSFTTFKVTQFALAQTDDKLGLVVDDLMDGVVPQLIESVTKGVTSLFAAEGENKALIEEVVENAIVSTFVSSLGSMLPEDEAAAVQEKLTPEKVEQLKTTFRKMDTVTSEAEVEDVIDEFIVQVSEILGEDYISAEDEQALKDFVIELYNDTVAEVENTEGAEFGMEALICVAVSKNIPLDDIDISKMLDEFLNQSAEGEKAPSKKALAEGEEVEQTVVVNYNDLLGEMGLGDDKIDELSEKLTTVLKATVDKSIGGVKADLSEYGWVYDYIYWLILAVMLVFILPWFFLALISFIKIFTKNKRFTMWYVKLYSFIPGLIALALLLVPFLAPKILSLGFLEIAAEEAAEILGYINIACAGVSSFTWVTGLCYLALWLVSIFWAFPIKHKIRKERKACKRAKKNGTYKFEEFEDEYGHAVAPENTNGYGETQPDYDGSYGYYDNTDYGTDSTYYDDDDDDDGFDSYYTYDDYDDLDDEY